MSYKEILTASKKEKLKHGEFQKKIILDVKKICDDANITIYPIAGTLIGFIREGKAILHDEDADFFIWHTDFDKFINLEQKFINKGYILGGTGMKSKYRHIDIKPKLDNQHFSASISCKIKDRNNVISLQFNDNNMIDRFMQRHGIKNRFWVKINKCYRYILMLKTKRTVLPYEWFSHYIDLDIYGTKFKIICGYEQFLIARYGVNWKTPDTERKYWKERIIHSKHYRVRDKDVLKLWLDH